MASAGGLLALAVGVALVVFGAWGSSTARASDSGWTSIGYTPAGYQVLKKRDGANCIYVLDQHSIAVVSGSTC